MTTQETLRIRRMILKCDKALLNAQQDRRIDKTKWQRRVNASKAVLSEINGRMK